MAHSIGETFFVCEMRNAEKESGFFSRILIPCKLHFRERTTYVTQEGEKRGYASKADYVIDGSGTLIYTHAQGNSPGFLTGPFTCNGDYSTEEGSVGITTTVTVTVRQDKPGLTGSTSPNVIIHNDGWRYAFHHYFTADVSIDPIQESEDFILELGVPELVLFRSPMHKARDKAKVASAL
jgi:hypothetical protein